MKVPIKSFKTKINTLLMSTKWSGRCKGINFETKKTHTYIYFTLGQRKSQHCIVIPNKMKRKINQLELFDFISQRIQNKDMYAFYNDTFNFEEFMDKNIASINLISNEQKQAIA